MQWSRVPFILLALAGTVSCASKSTETGAPLQLNVRRSDIPGPGFCRVIQTGSLPRACDGIENTAPFGSRILYRPDDGSRTVQVWYMSTGERGIVIGIDLFNIDTRRLVRVIKAREAYE